MKKLLMAVAVAVMFSAPVQAKDNCEGVSEIANSIMVARQSGVAMKEMVVIVNNSDFEAEVKGVLIEMVVLAWEQPAYSSPEYQKKIIREFTDMFYLQCVKSHI